MTGSSELPVLIDRVAIADVLHLGCRMLDENDLDLLPRIFAERCRVRFRPGADHERTGLDELRTYFGSAGARLAACSHHLSNIEIGLVDDATADVRSYFYAGSNAAAAGAHDRHRLAVQVEIEDAVPVLVKHLVHRHVPAGTTGVVHEDVDRTELLDRLLDKRLAPRLLADVPGDEPSMLGLSELFEGSPSLDPDDGPSRPVPLRAS